MNHFDEPPPAFTRTEHGRTRAPSSPRRKRRRTAGGLGALVVAEAGGRARRVLHAARGDLADRMSRSSTSGSERQSKIDRLTVHWPVGICPIDPDLPQADRTLAEDGGRACGASKRRPLPSPPLFTASAALARARHRRALRRFPAAAAAPRTSSRSSDPAWRGATSMAMATSTFSWGAPPQRRSPFYQRRARPRRDFSAPSLARPRRRRRVRRHGSGLLRRGRRRRRDLYVVSGGVECAPGADVLRDRCT